MNRIFKIFFTLLFAVLFSLPSFASNLGITVISDVHLSSDKQNNKMTPSIKRLIEAVEQANSNTSDFVVFLGDNVSGASKYDIAMFAKVIKRLKKPYYVLVGNRDINRGKSVNKKEFYRIVNKYSSNKLNALPCYKKYDDYILIFMSGVNETFPTTNGYYKEGELDFLDETLSKYSDKKAIIFQHFPVVEPKENRDLKTHKAEDYIAVLARHKNVLAVISGHYHYENVTKDDLNVTHISVGGLLKGEYEQIKFFKNKDGSYSITERIIEVE